MLDLAVGFLACGDKLPAGKRVGDLHLLGRRRRVDGGCLRGGRARSAGARRRRRARRSTCTFRPTARRRTRSIPPRRACTSSAMPTFARLVAQSPLIDGVMVVVTARRSAFLEGDLQKLKDLEREATSRCSCGPTRCRPSAASRSSTRPAIRCSPARTAARAPCAAMADYRALRERLLQQPARDRRQRSRARPGARACSHASAGAERMAGAAAARRLWHRRRTAARLAHSADEAEDSCARAWPAGRAQGAIRRHPAQDRSRRGRAQCRRRRCARRL